MPVETRRSAVSRMSLSVTRPAKKFQEFQPMGGVAASLAAGACAEIEAVTVKSRARARAKAFMGSSFGWKLTRPEYTGRSVSAPRRSEVVRVWHELRAAN